MTNTELTNTIKRIAYLRKYQEEMQALKDSVKAELLARGESTYIAGSCVAMLSKPGTRTDLDSTRLKADYPELVKAYSKTSTTAPRLTIK